MIDIKGRLLAFVLGLFLGGNLAVVLVVLFLTNKVRSERSGNLEDSQKIA